MQKFKEYVKKTYHFLFKDDSILSWVVNIVLAFILVKFVIYPLLALILGSSLPLVAVISGSMEHNGMDFDTWWDANGAWYEEHNISKDMFSAYSFTNGFDKGDVMILGRPGNVSIGDVLVYQSPTHPYPIIHRVTYINGDGSYIIKGDNNDGPDPAPVQKDQVLGKALYRIPKIGWVKIWFSELTGL